MTFRPSPTSSCAPRGGGASGSCGPPPEQPLDSLQAIVDDYRAEYVPGVEKEKQYFGDKYLPFDELVQRAALSRWPNGDVHGHQRRPQPWILLDCADKLKGHEGELEVFTRFEKLHERIETILNADGGNRKLISYDIAERLGWRLGLQPERVYLHCGTREGAEVFWPGIRARTVDIGDFRPELQSLSPAHLENLLCIYKEALASLKARGLL